MTPQKPKGSLKVIETSTATITLINDSIASVQAKPEVHIGREQAIEFNQLILDSISGNYGMIIDRKADYSIMPVDVFEELNNNKRLKAIAIVIYHKSSASSINIFKLLSQTPLEVFFSIDEAKNWLDQILDIQQ